MPIIRSNIVVSNTASIGGGMNINSDIITLDYNDVWNNAGGDYSGVSPGTHDISADPLLVDPTNGDFHLAPGSPCIDAGDPKPSRSDFEGDPRPMGLAPDIGVDEYRTLWVAKIGTPDETTPGTPVTYTVTLGNTGDQSHSPTCC